MKKYLMMLLAGVSLLTLVACGKDSQTETNGQGDLANQKLTFSQYVEREGTHIFFRTVKDEGDPKSIGYKDAPINMAMVFQNGKVTFYDLGYSIRKNSSAFISHRDDFWDNYERPTLGEMSKLSQDEQLALLKKKHQEYYEALLPVVKAEVDDSLERVTKHFNPNDEEQAQYAASVKKYTEIFQKVSQELSQDPSSFEVYTPQIMNYHINLVTDGTGETTMDEQLVLEGLSIISLENLPSPSIKEDTEEFRNMKDTALWEGDFTFYLSSPVQMSVYNQTISGYEIGSGDGFVTFQEVTFLIDQPDNRTKKVTVDAD